jgi:hypothetical protein
MRIRLPARRPILHVGFLLVTAAAVLAAAPMAAEASLPPPGATELLHSCVVIGSDGVTQAVHCADLLSVPSATAGTDYLGENEVLCQDIASRAIVECAGIHETPHVAVAELTIKTDPQGVCGVRFGHGACGAGRIINLASVPLQITAGSKTCHIWATSGVGSQVDSVVLPVSGKVVTAATNVETSKLAVPCAI